MEDTGAVQSEFDDSVSLSKPISHPVLSTDDNTLAALTSKMINDDKISEGSPISVPERLIHKNEILDRLGDIEGIPEANASSDPSLSPVDMIDEDLSAVKQLDVTKTNGTESSSILESDQFYPDLPIASVSEDTCLELPELPPFVELSKEQENHLKHMAIKHIIESYKHLHGTDYQQICMLLLTQLVAQIDDDYDFILMLQKHILNDQWRKITDACSACFEQRTVFTQQVLVKALNQWLIKLRCLSFS